MYCREETKMQIQIWLQFWWYHAYSILEQLKDEKNMRHKETFR